MGLEDPEALQYSQVVYDGIHAAFEHASVTIPMVVSSATPDIGTNIGSAYDIAQIQCKIDYSSTRQQCGLDIEAVLHSWTYQYNKVLVQLLLAPTALDFAPVSLSTVVNHDIFHAIAHGAGGIVVSSLNSTFDADGAALDGVASANTFLLGSRQFAQFVTEGTPVNVRCVAPTYNGALSTPVSCFAATLGGIDFVLVTNNDNATVSVSVHGFTGGVEHMAVFSACTIGDDAMIAITTSSANATLSIDLAPWEVVCFQSIPQCPHGRFQVYQSASGHFDGMYNFVSRNTSTLLFEHVDATELQLYFRASDKRWVLDDRTTAGPGINSFVSATSLFSSPFDGVGDVADDPPPVVVCGAANWDTPLSLEFDETADDIAWSNLASLDDISVSPADSVEVGVTAQGDSALTITDNSRTDTASVVLKLGNGQGMEFGTVTANLSLSGLYCYSSEWHFQHDERTVFKIDIGHCPNTADHICLSTLNIYGVPTQSSCISTSKAAVEAIAEYAATFNASDVSLAIDGVSALSIGLSDGWEWLGLINRLKFVSGTSIRVSRVLSVHALAVRPIAENCTGNWGSVEANCTVGTGGQQVATCGTGVAHETFAVSQPPTNGGQHCDAGNGELRFSVCDTGVECTNSFCAAVAVDVVDDAGTATSLGSQAGNLFDSDNSTRWITLTDSASVTFQHATKRAVQLSMYSITCDVGSPAGSDPTNWTVSSSNDGTTWTQIDARTGQSCAGPLDVLSYQLNTTANTTSSSRAKYFKFAVSAAATVGSGVNITALAVQRCVQVLDCVGATSALSAPDCGTAGDDSVNPVAGIYLPRSNAGGSEPTPLC